jgi:leucyl-tRNA synthetase
MMVYINEAEDFAKSGAMPKEYLEKFVLCLAPFAPHLGEELWSFLGNANTLAYEP